MCLCSSWLFGLHRFPPSERAGQRKFISVLKPHSGRQPLRNSGDAYVFRRQRLCQIIRSRLPFYIGADGQNDFFRSLGLNTFDQRIDPQVFRTDMIKRRKASAKRVIEPTESGSAFQGKYIRRLLYDTEQFPIPARIRADRAAFPFRKETAQHTWPNSSDSISDRFRDLRGPRVFLLDHPERHSLRTTRSDARHPPKLAD